MSVYKTTRLTGCELCHPINQSDFETIIVQINGELRKSHWKPIWMRLVQEDEGKRLIEADAPWLGPHGLIFKESATNVLKTLLEENGELLPLVCDGGPLWIFNPTRVVDALDEANSKLKRFKSGGIMMIDKHVFREKIVRDLHIFKIPNLRSSPVFVSQRFVDLWKSTGLIGLDFIHCESK